MTTHVYPIPIFMIQQSFMAATFLLLGGACKKYLNCLEDGKFHWWGLVIILAGCAGVILSYSMNDDRVLMLFNQYSNYGWFFLGAFAGIAASLAMGKYLYLVFSTIGVSNAVMRFSYGLMMWIGFNSLVLFPVHLIVNHYFSILYKSLGINHFPLRFAAMLIVGIPVCNVITNYLPWMLGQSRTLKRVEPNRNQK